MRWQSPFLKRPQPCAQLVRTNPERFVRPIRNEDGLSVGAGRNRGAVVRDAETL